MYENYTFEYLLGVMLEKVSDNVDKREGSIIYDALAPAALELSIAYSKLDQFINDSYADTAGREMLVRRARERGITPYSAIPAEHRCETNINIPIGTRFVSNGLFFMAYLHEKDCTYILRCETAGEAGNKMGDEIIPVEYIPGLSKIKWVECVAFGENEEETEHFRSRYKSTLSSQSYGGNREDYVLKVNSLSGVGGCHIYPAWAGGGTVKIVICDSNNKAPDDALVKNVQEIIDPITESGIGKGIAPIGHRVTVVGAEGVSINVGASFVLGGGHSFADIKGLAEAAIDLYFYELGKEWQESEKLIVRISQLERRFLDLPYVLDVTGTVLNDAAENLMLDADELPVRGVLSER